MGVIGVYWGLRALWEVACLSVDMGVEEDSDKNTDLE